MKKTINSILLALTCFSIFPQVVFSPSNYQNEMLLYVKSFLPSDPVILEAGGHFGEDTIRMKSIWPKATMHVFEPLPSSFNKMFGNTRHLSKVFCYPCALTNFSGKTDFYVDVVNNGASSIGYPVKWNESEFDKTPLQVPCVTINEWATCTGVSKIDFMWLDMEGQELSALLCASNVLDTVKAIFTEISFVPIREDSCSYKDLKKFLESKGLYEVWKSCSGGRFGDALFVRK